MPYGRYWSTTIFIITFSKAITTFLRYTWHKWFAFGAFLWLRDVWVWFLQQNYNHIICSITERIMWRCNACSVPLREMIMIFLVYDTNVNHRGAQHFQASKQNIELKFWTCILIKISFLIILYVSQWSRVLMQYAVCIIISVVSLTLYVWLCYP